MSSLFKSGIIVSACTMLSRLFGLLREQCIANAFGAGSAADCVNIALKIPNLLRRVLAEGAFSSVFVPMFNGMLTQSKLQATNFMNSIFTLLAIVMSILVVICQVNMEKLMYILAPGFSGVDAKIELAIRLCIITMPYMLLISLAAVCGSILNSFGKFIPFALMPVILNLGIVLASVWGNHDYIAYAVVLCGLLQLTIMYFLAYKHGLRVSFIGLFGSDTKLFLKKLLPAAASASAAQLNLFISQSIASYINGAISILGYAERIYQFPLSLIGTTISTVLLPTLTKLYRSDAKSAAALQSNVFKIAMYLSLGSSVFVCALSKQIVELIYYRGAFNMHDTQATAITLVCFGFGLPAFILNKVLSQGYYANLDLNTPMKITIYSILINAALNFIGMYYAGIYGIAIGSTAASWINASLLYAYGIKYFKVNRDLAVFLFKMICVSLITYSALCVSSHYLSKGIINLFINMVLCGVVYIGLSILTKAIKISELKRLRESIF